MILLMRLIENLPKNYFTSKTRVRNIDIIWGMDLQDLNDFDSKNIQDTV